MKKIIITYENTETGHKDIIGREIPNWDSYNFCKGILIDLYLLMDRNSLVPEWLRKQFSAMNLLEG